MQEGIEEERRHWRSKEKQDTHGLRYFAILISEGEDTETKIIQ